MRRRTIDPRAGWLDTVVSQGLVYEDSLLLPPGAARPYWDESVYYEFDLDEVLLLEAQVEGLHLMCLEAVEHVIAAERFRDFALPEFTWPAIVDSWRRRDGHLYGRFDLRYDGTGPAQLLEYNADTPTTLLEASILQWHWLKDVLPDHDQWNSLHERLVERWTHLGGDGLASSTIHFTWTNLETTGEDHLTTAYLQETAAEAGFDTVGLAIEDLGWDDDRQGFVDLAGEPIETLFKLYPWEWLIRDPFGRQAMASMPVGVVSAADLSAAGLGRLGRPRTGPDPSAPTSRGHTTTWIEPAWKALLSNKAILAVLWQLHPGHPSLLPAFLDDPGPLTEYIRKPKLGREGASMTIVTPEGTVATAGEYGDEGYVYQAFDPLPAFDGQHPVLGAWVVGDESAGLGIRESVGLVTDDRSSFVPHAITPATGGQ